MTNPILNAHLALQKALELTKEIRSFGVSYLISAPAASATFEAKCEELGYNVTEALNSLVPLSESSPT